MANKLTSTKTLTSCLLMHQVPCTGSACVTLAKMSVIIRLRRGSLISSSHPVVKAFTLRFTNVVATRNQPHTEKCPVNFPHTEKITPWLSTQGTVGSSLLRRHRSFPCSSQTRNRNTRVPCLNCSGILLVKTNCSRCSLMQAAEHTLSFTKMPSI